MRDCDAADQVSGVVSKRGCNVGVEAMCLAWELEVLASRAAVSTIPLPLIDRHGVSLLDVGQIVHVAPNVDRAAWIELEEVEEAVWIRSRVGRVRLHLAVGAPVRILDVRVDCFTIILHVLIVLDHIFVGLSATLRAIALLPFWRAVGTFIFPPVHVLGYSICIARCEGQNCEVSHRLFSVNFNYDK